MARRDLELNSLSRYSKQSPRFILEQYSFCEVPAGCGGVILRWRDPGIGLPILIKIYAGQEFHCYLDGEEIAANRPLIPFGEHVFAFEISQVDQRYLALAFIATFDENESQGIYPSRRTGQTVRIASSADGTWKYSTREPADDTWKNVAYDDSDWPAMVQREARRPLGSPHDNSDKWRLEWVVERGCSPLGFDTPASRIWVRKRFHLSPGGSQG